MLSHSMANPSVASSWRGRFVDQRVHEVEHIGVARCLASAHGLGGPQVEPRPTGTRCRLEVIQRPSDDEQTSSAQPRR